MPTNSEDQKITILYCSLELIIVLSSIKLHFPYHCLSKMLPFEINQKICENLSFLEVNRFIKSLDLHPNLDKRCVNEKPGFFICPPCLHSKIDTVVKEIFKIRENSREFKGMR